MHVNPICQVCPKYVLENASSHKTMCIPWTARFRIWQKTIQILIMFKILAARAPKEWSLGVWISLPDSLSHLQIVGLSIISLPLFRCWLHTIRATRQGILAWQLAWDHILHHLVASGHQELSQSWDDGIRCESFPWRPYGYDMRSSHNGVKFTPCEADFSLPVRLIFHSLWGWFTHCEADSHPDFSLSICLCSVCVSVRLSLRRSVLCG